LYVISYDITEDTRRRRVFEALKDYGRRVHFSVFECNLEAGALAELEARLGKEMELESDSCRIYRLCEGGAGEARIVGLGDRYKETGYVIV
jgi:CRISPR-associated protein Cas2